VYDAVVEFGSQRHLDDPQVMEISIK